MGEAKRKKLESLKKKKAEAMAKKEEKLSIQSTPKNMNPDAQPFVPQVVSLEKPNIPNSDEANEKIADKSGKASHSFFPGTLATSAKVPSFGSFTQKDSKPFGGFAFGSGSKLAFGQSSTTA